MLTRSQITNQANKSINKWGYAHFEKAEADTELCKQIAKEQGWELHIGTLLVGFMVKRRKTLEDFEPLKPKRTRKKSL